MSQLSPPITDDQSSTKKRTRVTPSQLSILEETFAATATPDSKMRKQLAQKLQMPERSIQIWFQNRRAKVKASWLLLQKRAQMQMDQASARTQLYQYQQQHGIRHPALIPYYSHQRVAIPRARSVDTAVSYENLPVPPPPPLPPYPMWHSPMAPGSYQALPPPPSASIDNSTMSPSSSLQPDMLYSSSSYSSSPSLNTFVPPPDQSTRSFLSMESHTPPASITYDMMQSMTGSPSVEPPAWSAVDPSVIQQKDEELYFSAASLTVGSWHRMKLHATDLVCLYQPETRVFAWHISDNGYCFKMEIAVNAVSRIEYVANDALADLHFEINAPPLFYMESVSEKTQENCWVQCSDFTENKQTSRFFRHTIKGVAHHIKQELLTLINRFEETRGLVQFVEPSPLPAVLPVDNPFTAYMDPTIPYFDMNPHPPTIMEESLPCEFFN
ncbi:hypothetical protein EC973_004709 [Apophysomyces ossiformis]|uniref:Homeobox domain-containing protein n=1 Tax=Apophysomyces ossiformis TaxID=679940 RepID=A0A8H7ELL4_9FUNG|nr:hypothetical protein EC973_004709 [Apophysomyces ossiformis]